MGVSVSYKGVGGQRNFDLAGLPTGDAELLLGSRKKKFVPENFRRALTPQPIDPTAEKEKGLVKLNEYDMRPAPLDKKTMPGSAVIASPTGLCLEGEQQNPVVLGDKIYGSHGGRKGYYSVDEIDPPTPAAERVGPLGAGGNGADDSGGKIGSPFAYQVAGRLNIEKNDNGDTVLVEYDKDVKTTALGRTSGVTGERRRVVGIFPSPEIRPPHPYEVRWASPVDVTEEGVEVPTLGAEHWQETEDVVFPLRCIRAEFRGEHTLTHRDILGSLMGEGIVREKVGDILVTDDSCDIIAAESVTEYLLSSWNSAGRAKLAVREILSRDLHIPVQKTEQIRDTVATLRLDAVASGGFRMSRGKAAELIAAGRVQVNWLECTKPDRLLSEGDVVSARGVGKFKLAQVGGTTKKGRISILLERYV